MGISASLKELTRKAKEDETFRAALAQAQSPQDVVAIANRAGIALTLKELQAGMSGSSGGEVAVLSGIQFELTQSVQRLEMIVKTSRVVRLDSRIPRFQVHNEEVVTATPVSESQIQLFAKSPGTTAARRCSRSASLTPAPSCAPAIASLPSPAASSALSLLAPSSVPSPYPTRSSAAART